MENFEAKRNALFACLDNASKELMGTGLDQAQSGSPTIDLIYRRSTFRNKSGQSISPSDKSLSRMRGKESIFKKPDLPISKCLKPGRVPDYKTNPQKWTKYSLVDVDISDHTNTAAAFQFLKQMDDELEMKADIFSNTDGRIEFKKSSKIRKQMRDKEDGELKDAEIDKPRLKGSKVIMPEYVVGQQKKSKKKVERNSECSTRAAGSLKLSHICEDGEDSQDYQG